MNKVSAKENINVEKCFTEIAKILHASNVGGQKNRERPMPGLKQKSENETEPIGPQKKCCT